MKGLIIRQPWIDMILAGEKRFEYRGNKTTHRGEIALIQGGSGTVVGVCDLIDVHGPLTGKEHTYYAKTYGWELTNVRRLKEPVAYNHPSGAVIWVNLPEDVAKHVKDMIVAPSSTITPKNKIRRAITYKPRKK